MKKVVVIFILFFALQNINANTQDSLTVLKADSVHCINEISLVVTDLIDGSYMFRYERKLSKHISVGLGTALKSKDGLLSISGIDREKIKTGGIEYSGFKLVPDVRYYLNKTQQFQLDGFYFGAYIKYFHFNSNINGSYMPHNETIYVLDMDAKINIFSMGFMVGYKLALGKRFNVDFLIFGPGRSRHSYKIENKSMLPEEFYNDLNEALKNFSAYDFIESDFRFDFKDARSEFTTLAFRYGLTIGYTF